MYSLPDVESARLSDEDASGDSDRWNHVSGQQVDSALTLGFSENMRKLKEANERTLDLCNRLCYQESEEEAQEDDEEQEEYEYESGSDHGLQEERTHTQASKSAPFFITSDSELLNKSVGSMQNILAQNVKDNVRDFSTADKAQDSPKTSKGVRLDPRPRIRCFEASLSENDESEYERYKENRFVTIHNDTLQSAMARIEDMWGAFAVDDYAPWSSFRQSMNVKRSQSLTKVDAESKNNRNATSVWKKKATVPDPPKMLLRDANKTPKKTKAMIELDQQREEKKLREEMECRKQFRARAAPDHIRFRLLEEMNQQQEERRRLLRENGEEILKSLQKPFEFIEREEQKKKEKLKEMQQSSVRQSKGQFRARPFPAHIFNGTVEDKILEEEEYRRIRMRMRAEELLNSSTVPYSMRVRDRAERRFRKMENSPKVESFRPRVNQTIPDLDEQYQRFMEQMIKRKEGKKLTTCQPFNLRLSKTMPKKCTSPCRGSHDATRLSRQWMLGNEHVKGALSSSLEAIPTHLREEKRKSSGQRSKRKRLMQKELTQKARNDDARWNALPGDVVYTLDDSDDLVRSGDSPNILQPGSRNQMRSSKQKQSDLGDTYEGNDQLALNNSDRLNLTYELDNNFVTYFIIKSDLGDTYEGNDQLALNNSGRLNLTYELDNSDGDDDASERAPSDFWSHPSLVRRSEFWSNPVASIH